MRKVFAVCLALIGLGVATQTQAMSLRSAFKSISTHTTWPVADSTTDDLASAFGPRVAASSDSYDWHDGVDVDADQGTSVLAVTDGELWTVAEYENGGTTVVLRHAFSAPVTFHDQELGYYYTYYMHLSDVEDTLEAASLAGEHPSVAQGAKVGEVGHTGNALNDHLHFELRVGTECSLSYQIDHPTSSCAQYGFDPGVSPLLFFAPAAKHTTLTVLTGDHESNQRVLYKAPDDQLLLNKIVWKVTRRSTGEVVHRQLINYNTRAGLDPGVDYDFDTQDKTDMYIAPRSLYSSSDWFRSLVVIPQDLVQAYPDAAYKFTLTTKDIWGRRTAVSW